MRGVNDRALPICQMPPSALLTLAYLVLTVTPCLRQDGLGCAAVPGNPKISEVTDPWTLLPGGQVAAQALCGASLAGVWHFAGWPCGRKRDLWSF